MLYQFTTLLLAALLGIAGSVDVVDSASRQPLTPTVISKLLVVVDILNHGITQHPAAKLPAI